MYEKTDTREERAKYLIKILAFTIMYTIISQILMPFANEVQMVVFDRVLIQNWGIGLFFIILFIFFFIINELPLFIFRANKINKFLILFWLSWIIEDWEAFIYTILEILF